MWSSILGYVTSLQEKRKSLGKAYGIKYVGYWDLGEQIGNIISDLLGTW